VALCGLNSHGSGQGPVAGFCGHGNETSVSINNKNLLIIWETSLRKKEFASLS
jgi:hypothetical protein